MDGMTKTNVISDEALARRKESMQRDLDNGVIQWWDRKTDTWMRSDEQPVCQDHLGLLADCPFHPKRT